MPQAPLLLAADLSAREILTCPTFWGLLLGAIGLWFLIPGGFKRFKLFGGVLAAAGMACLFTDLGWIGTRSTQVMFWLVAGITLFAAVGAISSQSPVYSAVWFALSLLGTSGIFLMQGAQFLGVATIVVYAGAIVVTFLFVLMLAQPEGHATYDRISWGSGPTALGIVAAGALVGLLTHSLSDLKKSPERLPIAPVALSSGEVVDPAATSPISDKFSVQQPQHMAQPGSGVVYEATDCGGNWRHVAARGARRRGRHGHPGQAHPPGAGDMNEVQLLYNTLILGSLLFAIGFLGFLTRRNLIVMFLCAEMMLQGVSVSLVAWGRYHNDWGGQMLVIFIITVAACEAAIAMALVMLLVQRSGKLDALWWQDLREATQPAFVDQAIPEERLADEHWPKLTPAGIEPLHDIDEELHRPRM